MINNLLCALEILRHKFAFAKVARTTAFFRQHLSWFTIINHDLGKLLLTLVCGDRIATRVHRKVAGHHRGVNMTHAQCIEAMCDWECARYTKPSKPLNAYDTWQTYYADVDMELLFYQYRRAG